MRRRAPPQAWEVCSGAGRRPSPTELVLMLGRGCPQASLAGRVLLSLWDEEMGSAVRVGALAGVPSKNNPGPLPTTQMVSSASQPSHLASCLSLFVSPWPPEIQLLLRGMGTELAFDSVVLTPWKENEQDVMPPPTHCSAGPCSKGHELPCNLVLAIPGRPWEQCLGLPVSFIFCLGLSCPQGLPS